MCKIWGFHGGDYEETASSGMLRRVVLLRTDISEEHSVSFIRKTTIGAGTTLAVTSNRLTLRAHSVTSQKKTFFTVQMFLLWVRLIFCTSLECTFQHTNVCDTCHRIWRQILPTCHNILSLSERCHVQETCISYFGLPISMSHVIRERPSYDQKIPLRTYKPSSTQCL
jgi:hypothetical protein